MSFSLPLLLVCCLFLLFSEGNVPFIFNSYFFIDEAGAYMSLISVIFFILFLSFMGVNLSRVELFCLIVSMISSVVCFTSLNIILFWISYEITIIPLLIALLAYSPYSERFLAGWYLLCYVLATSIPMLLLFLYVGYANGSLNILMLNDVNLVSSLILAILFSTKIPLPPFHSWLPVVHAEASTFVSVSLSGYVMKLGIIGIIRFCPNLFTFSNVILFFIFSFSLLFLLCSCFELDTKRWLAFLSLSHIIICVVGIHVSSEVPSYFPIFCLGHGISAGLLFFCFSGLYEAIGSRNWLLISYSSGVGIAWTGSLIAALVTVSSLPPSISFFSEVLILLDSFNNSFISSPFSIYLLLSALVPMALIAFLVSNSSAKGLFNELGYANFFLILCLFSLWILGGFFF